MKRQNTGSELANRDIIKHLFSFLMSLAGYALKINRMAPPLSSKYCSFVHKHLMKDDFNSEEKEDKTEKWELYFLNPKLTTKEHLDSFVASEEEKASFFIFLTTRQKQKNKKTKQKNKKKNNNKKTLPF